MKKYFKMFGAVGLLAGMMMLAGCGDDAAPSTVSKSTTIPTTSVKAGTTAGTIETTVAVAPTAAVAVGTQTLTAAVTIPIGVVITPPAGSTFSATAPPTIVITQPVNGTTAGLPAITSGTTFTVADAAGSADYAISGVSSFTLSGVGASVKIPVVKAPDNTVTPQVVAVKANGATTVYPKAGSTTSYTAAVGTTSGYVTVNNVTDFCWFIVNPKKASTTGTGSVPIF
jgi:hypothetical protein